MSSCGWKNFPTVPIPTGFTQQDEQKQGGSVKNIGKAPIKGKIHGNARAEGSGSGQEKLKVQMGATN